MCLQTRFLRFGQALILCLIAALGSFTAVRVVAQPVANSRAKPLDVPLQIFISGSGHIVPFHNGQLLRVGPMYSMTAIPNRGRQFIGWNRVHVFEIIERNVGASGATTAVTNTVVSQIGGFIHNRTLKFQVNPPTVILNDPGVRMLIESDGWQANFSGAE